MFRFTTVVAVFLLSTGSVACDNPAEPQPMEEVFEPHLTEYRVSGIVRSGKPPVPATGAVVYVFRGCEPVNGVIEIVGDSVDVSGRFDFVFTASNAGCNDRRKYRAAVCKVGSVVQSFYIEAAEPTHNLELTLSTAVDWGWSGPGTTRAESCPEV